MAPRPPASPAYPHRAPGVVPPPPGARSRNGADHEQHQQHQGAVMERLELRIGTAGERLALETYRDGATVLEVLDADRRPANGARVLPAELEILGAVISHRALAVRDPVAGAGDSPRGEDLDRILRWALERLMAAEPGAASAVLVAAREETGIGLEAFWLSDRGRR